MNYESRSCHSHSHNEYELEPVETTEQVKQDHSYDFIETLKDIMNNQEKKEIQDSIKDFGCNEVQKTNQISEDVGCTFY